MSEKLDRARAALAALPGHEGKQLNVEKISKSIKIRCPHCHVVVARVTVGRRMNASEYNLFIKEAMKRGMTLSEAAVLWKTG